MLFSLDIFPLVLKKLVGIEVVTLSMSLFGLMMKRAYIRLKIKKVGTSLW